MKNRTSRAGALLILALGLFSGFSFNDMIRKKPGPSPIGFPPSKIIPLPGADPSCQQPYNPTYVGRNTGACLKEFDSVVVTSFTTIINPLTSRYVCSASFVASTDSQTAEGNGTGFTAIPFDQDDAAVNLCTLFQTALVSKASLNVQASPAGGEQPPGYAYVLRATLPNN